METDSSSNNHKNRSKKKQVQHANQLQKESIHFEYYQQKNGFEGENLNKLSELAENKRKKTKHGPFKTYDYPNLDQLASKEERNLAEILKKQQYCRCFKKVASTISFEKNVK